MAYSAHPFLREFFRNLLGTEPESVHELVRAKLAPTLEARPEEYPSNPAILDRYEILIEQTLLAGHVQDAFDLYWYGLGSYQHLGKVLGENARGLRILERFIPQDDFSGIEPHLSPRVQASRVSHLGLFASNLGDLARARKAFGYCRRLSAAAFDKKNESIDSWNLAEVELYAGYLRQSLAHSEDAVSLATETGEEIPIKNSLVYRPTSHFALGNITAATADYYSATELEGRPLFSLRGIWEAKCKVLRGDRSGARSQTQANRERAVRHKWNATLCGCDTILAQAFLPDSPARAGQHLQDARAFANRSGDVELQLGCFYAACNQHLHLADYPQAIAEAEAGILLADTCNFGRYSIDLRLVLAEALLAAGDARKALQNAREALDRSEQPDCAYAWGQADGLHFCGLAHLRLGEHELARERLTAALELRERLGHGRIEETRRALDSLPRGTPPDR